MTFNSDFADFIGSRLYYDEPSKSKQQALDKQELQYKTLLSSLDDTQKSLFEQYVDITAAINCKNDYDAYSKGFIDGITLTSQL